MAKLMNELIDKAVKDAKPGAVPRRLVDGGGLFLLINPGGSKLWRLKHKGTLLSFGAYPEVSLKQARERRAAAKLPCTPTLDAPRDTSPTFRVAAAEWHAAERQWSDTNRRVVSNLLEKCVFPHIGDMQMGKLTKTVIFDLVVKPFEARGAIERGERAVGYVRRIFDWVNTRSNSLPEDYNPARNIKLVARKPVKHYPALTKLPEVRDMLRTYERAPKHPSTVLANRLMALTAMRTYAIRRAEFDQFVLDGDCPRWEAPAAIMKGETGERRELTIPLAPQAVEIVRAARRLTQGKYLFEGRALNSKISEGTLLCALNDAGYAGVHCPHGWRSTFSTVLNNRHSGKKQVIDFAIGHQVPGTSGDYNRADYLDERQQFAIEYADLLLGGFCPAADLLGAKKD